jgi:hypothetical protein
MVFDSDERAPRTGWASGLAKASMAALVFEAVSGLAITFSPLCACGATAWQAGWLDTWRRPWVGHWQDWQRLPD